MSESRFVEESGRKFREKHRAEDGWIVFRIDLDYYGAHMWLLPAFLMATAPRAVARKNLYIDVKLGGGTRRTCFTELPWKRRKFGLEDENWFGEMEIVWQGIEIHCLRQTRLQEGWRHPLETTWIATKKRDAFEDMWKKLFDFHDRHFRPSEDIDVINGGYLKRPKLAWEDLILPGTMAAEIRADAESFLDAKAHYKALKLPYRRGYLFAGPPGVGKTFAAKVLYSKLKASAYTLDLKAEIDDADLKEAFTRAAKAAPSILLLEDLDRLVRSAKISMAFLLNLLDGLQTPEGLLLFATTNAPERLDQALLHRPSRFDRVWHFPLPGRDERLRLLQRRAGKKFSKEAILSAADKTGGFTMAYTQEAVVSALLAAVYARRAPQDSDLLASVETLARQVRDSRKKDGEIRVDSQVGFAVAANGR